MNFEVKTMLKKGLGQIISEKFDIPLECLSTVPNAQIIGNSMLSVDGCVGIKKYEENEIIIRTIGFILKINGNELSMLTFSGGRVSVRGEIHSYGIENL